MKRLDNYVNMLKGGLYVKDLKIGQNIKLTKSNGDEFNYIIGFTSTKVGREYNNVALLKDDKKTYAGTFSQQFITEGNQTQLTQPEIDAGRKEIPPNTLLQQPGKLNTQGNKELAAAAPPAAQPAAQPAAAQPAPTAAAPQPAPTAAPAPPAEAPPSAPQPPAAPQPAAPQPAAEAARARARAAEEEAARAAEAETRARAAAAAAEAETRARAAEAETRARAAAETRARAAAEAEAETRARAAAAAEAETRARAAQAQADRLAAAAPQQSAQEQLEAANRRARANAAQAPKQSAQLSSQIISFYDSGPADPTYFRVTIYKTTNGKDTYVNSGSAYPSDTIKKILDSSKVSGKICIVSSGKQFVKSLNGEKDLYTTLGQLHLKYESVELFVL